MRIARGHGPLPPGDRGGAIALGNFDGFHLGHQAVVARAREWARAHGRPLLVGSFDPNPARFFQPDRPPALLTTIAERLALFEAFGVDIAVVWAFDAAFARLGAAAFVDDELAARLGVGHVVTGWDYSFGHGRGGDAATLAAAAQFTAEALPPVMQGGAPVSSTRARGLLRDGKPGEAAALLTRPFAIGGIVAHGAKLGRTLGFPTANLVLGDYLRPAYGVYAVRCVLPDGTRRDGVANLGIRPMFVPAVELLETFIFDFAGDLYGQPLTVELHHYLRPEWVLDGLDALTRQIEADKARARELLGAAPPR